MDAAAVVKLQSDSSDLILEESFERALHDIQNFTPIEAVSYFSKRYPELASTLMAADLQLSLPLSDIEQGEFDGEAPIQHDQQEQMAESPTHYLGAHKPEFLSHSHRLDTGADLACTLGIDASDLVALDCWNETISNQQLEDCSMEHGQIWDPMGFFPESLSLPHIMPSEAMRDR